MLNMSLNKTLLVLIVSLCGLAHLHAYAEDEMIFSTLTRGMCTIDITGTVVDVATSLGLENVTVFLFDELFTTSLAQATTDSQGLYIFTNIDQMPQESTTYGVRALAPTGYLPAEQNVSVVTDCDEQLWTAPLIEFVPLSSDPLTLAIQNKYFDE